MSCKLPPCSGSTLGFPARTIPSTAACVIRQLTIPPPSQMAQMCLQARLSSSEPSNRGLCHRECDNVTLLVGSSVPVSFLLIKPLLHSLDRFLRNDLASQSEKVKWQLAATTPYSLAYRAIYTEALHHRIGISPSSSLTDVTASSSALRWVLPTTTPFFEAIRSALKYQNSGQA